MLTRRRLLELGAAACLAVMLGHVRSARASATDASAAQYLRRGSWLPLIGRTVAVEGVTLRLAEVADLPQLTGRDDAFRLEFTGRAGALQSGTQTFALAALGSFVMFVSPVDTVVGGEQCYEVVVDRSVGVPGLVPTAGSTAPVSAPASASASPSQGSAPSAPAPSAPHRRPRKRRHLARHHARWRHKKVRSGRTG